jgi:putative ABC transport system substrate-binding protein
LFTTRSVLLAGGIGLLVAHRLSLGQPAATIRRVGYLAFGSEASNAHLRTAFSQGMQDLGWLEGKNVEYRFVYANGDVHRLDALASELIEQQVSVILVGAAKALTRRSRRRRRYHCSRRRGERHGRRACRQSGQAGRQHHRIHRPADEVLGKLIGILHEISPRARRIAILLNESNPLYAAYWAGAQSACAALDLVSLRVVASTPAQLDAAVEQMVRQRAQAIVVTSDGMYFTERAKLQELMRPPGCRWRMRCAITWSRRLLSYGYDIAANYRNAAK